MQPKTILRLPAVQAKTGLSRSTIYRLESTPGSGFPQRVRLGENSTGWFADEIDSYLASRPRVSETPKASDNPEVALPTVKLRPFGDD